MRLGVLDIGSNSAQLQIVDGSAGGPPLPAHAIKEPTLLGESTLPDGSIDPDGIGRVVEAVSRTVRMATLLDVEHLYPFVTSAIRDASNREMVLDEIQDATGLRPQYLSGDQEARLTYLAAHRWYGWSGGRLLLFDIGGGSMEIVLGRDVEPQLAISLPLGAGRLTRELLPGDPPGRRRVKALRHYVRDTLGEVVDRLRWEGDPRRVVATSKTFKQLARLAGAPAQRKGPFVKRTLRRRDVQDWIPRLAALPAPERAALRGVSKSRARQLLAGAVVAHATMAALDVKYLEICPWALREGIVLRHLEQAAGPGPLPLQALQPFQQSQPVQALRRTAADPDATVTALERHGS
jgi:exopolyphosphatase / guanosine-5'-triphosphate,3'-diphosphate pyrophosphatase